MASPRRGRGLLGLRGLFGRSRRPRRSGTFLVLAVALCLLAALAASLRTGFAFVPASGCGRDHVATARAADAKGGGSDLPSLDQLGASGPAVAKAATAKEVDEEALVKYAAEVGAQVGSAALVFGLLDFAGISQVMPTYIVFSMFFLMSFFSNKLTLLDRTERTDTRPEPQWKPSDEFQAFLDVFVVAGLRGASSVVIFEKLGRLLDLSTVLLVLAIALGNIALLLSGSERRLGAAFPASAVAWLFCVVSEIGYSAVVPLAGTILLPSTVWLLVGVALNFWTWRMNNEGDREPLYPYRGSTKTRFWFS